jgi:hypothetical protein
MTPKEAIDRLQTYRLKMNLNKSALAALMRIPDGTLNAWLADPKMKSHRLPGEDGVKLIIDFLGRTGNSRTLLPDEESLEDRPIFLKKVTGNTKSQKEASERIARLRLLFSLIAQDLDWLRNSSKEDRELYRSTLDNRDVGYLSSLMSMLCDETQFQRWQQFTTYRFRQFKNSQE